MDLRRKLPPKPPSSTINHHRKPLTTTDSDQKLRSKSPPSPVPKASDALPLPLYLTNGIFFTLFFCVSYYLLHRWRDKIRSSTPLHVVTLSELAAILSLIASFIYLLGFFGIDFVQQFVSQRNDEEEEEEEEEEIEHSFVSNSKAKPVVIDSKQPVSIDSNIDSNIDSIDDDKLIECVMNGSVPSYSLESKLDDCFKAASIRRRVLERTTGRSLVGLPLEGFDYGSILGQCCEMPIGYVQIPVGIAGPLLMNGCEYMVPMATTEGCLVASTNRGCKAIYASGGSTAILLKDGMTRAPVVRFATTERASQLKFFLEDGINFDTLSVVFNK